MISNHKNYKADNPTILTPSRTLLDGAHLKGALTGGFDGWVEDRFFAPCGDRSIAWPTYHRPSDEALHDLTSQILQLLPLQKQVSARLPLNDLTTIPRTAIPEENAARTAATRSACGYLAERRFTDAHCLAWITRDRYL